MDSSTRGLVIAGGALLLVALVFSTLTGGMMGSHMFGPGRTEGGAWMWGLGMGFGGLAMLLFWGVLILGIVLLARSLGGEDLRGGGATPLDVLKRRYAAGELTDEEFDAKRKRLEAQ